MIYDINVAKIVGSFNVSHILFLLSMNFKTYNTYVNHTLRTSSIRKYIIKKISTNAHKTRRKTKLNRNEKNEWDNKKHSTFFFGKPVSWVTLQHNTSINQ